MTTTNDEQQITIGARRTNGAALGMERIFACLQIHFLFQFWKILQMGT